MHFSSERGAGMPTSEGSLISIVDGKKFELISGVRCNSIEKTDDNEDLLPNILHIIVDTTVFALFKWSILISLVQTVFLVILLIEFGTVPIEHNPYWGPSVNILIRFGAKDAELVARNGEYWRLLSAIMLHAGIYHLLGNISLQILISGYLEHSWGVCTFLSIYVSTGVVGYLFSCTFLYSSVSVGSSGSIMGLLASWLVDIIFSLKRMRFEGDSSPLAIRNQYIMLYSVAAAIILTLGTSWNSGVDWASHAGGCLYGSIWACAIFTDRPRKESTILPLGGIQGAEDRILSMRWTVRTTCVILLFAIPLALLISMILREQNS